MKTMRRVKEIFSGILMMFCCFILILIPEEGYFIVPLILSVSLIFSGIRSLLYYFFMARHMVGGKVIFYQGLIVLDLGMFTYTLVDVPLMYVILYLLACHAFSGAIDIMRAFEAKRLHAPSWRFSMTSGVLNIAIMFLSFFCGVIMRSTTIVVYIYCAGLLYSACARIVTAFRKTAIVYVPS